MGITELLSWGAPVVLGALIGWVTNAIAIRMLFRPYKAWYLGPFKVPMTPGIIPRQRERLAKSLGHMVAGELFQEEGLVRHLRTPVIKAAVKDSVSRLSSSLLAAPAEADATLTEAQDPRLAGDLEALGLKLLTAFVRSARFHSAALDLGRGLVSGFLDRKPGDPARARAFSIFLRRELRTLKPGPEARQRLKEAWVRLAGTWKERELALADLLGEAWIDLAIKASDSLYPSLEEFLRSLLSMPEIRNDLNERAFVLLSHALERLNAFQRSLLWIGGYEAKLRESLPDLMIEALDSLADFLRQDKTRHTLVAKLGEALTTFGRTPVGELEARHGFSLENLGSGLIDQICDVLSEGKLPPFLDARGKSGPSVAGILGDTADSTWGQILEERFGLPCNDLCTRLVTWTVHRLRTPEGLELMAGLGRSLVRGFSAPTTQAAGGTSRVAGMSIQGAGSTISGTESPAVSPPALDALGEGEKDHLDDYASVLLLKTLETVLPKVLETFNLQQFVEARVAELDVKELEGLIVGLVGKEFTWINLLGGVLGGLVGLMQVVVQLLIGKV